MATKSTLTSAPQLLSDGTKQVHVTVEKGSVFHYAVSDTKPSTAISPTEIPHTCNEKMMNIEVGFKVWAWASHGFEVLLACSSSS